MEKLTIAQALRKIKKLKGQLAEAQAKAILGVSYEQTKKPEFSFEESFKEMQSLSIELVILESKVAEANAKTIVEFNGDKVSLCVAIRTLQEIKGLIAFLKGLILKNEVIKEVDQFFDEEINKYVNRALERVFVSELTGKDRDSQVRDLQDRFEALNNLVENANHRTEI